MQREPGQTFFLVTQGCKVNQYETQAIREAWLAEGLLETNEPSQADIVLVNSCAVTERAIADLGKLVRPLAALCPKPRIMVTGCAVEADRERVAALPGVDNIITREHKPELGGGAPRGNAFPDLRITGYHRARAVLKVQDGCSHGCTYCIIPSTRGPSVSREPAAVIHEAENLLSAGIPEISLCGINLRQYGRDLSARLDFWDLLAATDRALAPRWAGKARLRIGSLEPGDLTSKALDTLAACRLMSPHLHVSLQSGSPEILRRMGRGHYNPDQIFHFLSRLTTVWPVFALGVDIIAGFPGETDLHLLETLHVVQCLPLSYAHVFPYSERPGTPAARFPERVPPHIRRERSKMLRTAVAKQRGRFLDRLLRQKPMHIVLENTTQGMNEWYVECRLETPVTLPPRTMLAVSPVQRHPIGLLVRPMAPVAQTPPTR